MPYFGIKGELSTTSNELGLELEWIIPDFFGLSPHPNGYYLSPIFSFENANWNLVIFPNCFSEYNSFRHIELRLRRASTGHPCKLEIAFSFKTANGEKYQERSRIWHSTVQMNCYHSLPRSELTRRQSELLFFKALTVVCTIKKQTSDGSAREHKNAECTFCRKTYDPVGLLTHEKKCLERPIKCPQCCEVILLQDWYDHECHTAETEGETCANLHRDLKELFINQEDTDVIIKVKGQEFMAHRIILKSRSPVFAAIFRHNMKENATGAVDIEDCDPASFSDFLCFLYCGDTQIVSRENAFGLFFGADKYEVLDLRKKCLEFITKNLSVEMFCDTINLALRYTETELIELCTDFFIRNAEIILETVKWQIFVNENPTQGNELFLKYVKSVKQSKV